MFYRFRTVGVNLEKGILYYMVIDGKRKPRCHMDIIMAQTDVEGELCAFRRFCNGSG